MLVAPEHGFNGIYTLSLRSGPGSSVGCTPCWYLGGCGFSPLVQKHSFVEIGHEIISTAILSLPLIQVGQLSVTGESMCTLQYRNDITTLASYDRHGSDSILSPQCNSWKVIHFSLIIWVYKVCIWIFYNNFLSDHLSNSLDHFALDSTFYSSVKKHYFCYLPNK